MKLKAKVSCSRSTKLCHIFTPLLLPSLVFAGPKDGVALVGHFTSTKRGQLEMINTSRKYTAIQWGSFNVDKKEHVHFNTPTMKSVVLNQVTGRSPSFLAGKLTSNGQLVLLNANGVLIGKDAKIDAAGILVAAGRLKQDSLEQFERNGNFSLSLGQGGVLNYGNLSGGFVSLLGGSGGAHNYGKIHAPAGQVVISDRSGRKAVNVISDGLINFAVSENLSDINVVEVDRATARRVLDGVINLTGYKKAKLVKKTGPNDVVLLGPAGVSTDDVDVSSSGQGGQIHLHGKQVKVSGQLNLRGNQNGGDLTLGNPRGQGTRSSVVTVDKSAKIDLSARESGKSGTAKLTGQKINMHGKVISRGSLTNDIIGGHVELDASVFNITGDIVTYGLGQFHTGDLILRANNIAIANKPGDNTLGTNWLGKTLERNNVELQVPKQHGQITFNKKFTYQSVNNFTASGHTIVFNSPVENTNDGRFEVVSYSRNGLPIQFNSGSYIQSLGPVSLYYHALNYKKPLHYERKVRADQTRAYMWVHNIKDFTAMHKNIEGNYALSQDLDFGGHENSHIPLGGDVANMYRGHFDGRGHTIRNFVQNIPDKVTLMNMYKSKGITLSEPVEHGFKPDERAYTLGIIGSMTGSVQRLNLENISIAGGDYVMSGAIGTIARLDETYKPFARDIKARGIFLRGRERSTLGGLFGLVDIGVGLSDMIVEDFDIQASKIASAGGAFGFLRSNARNIKVLAASEYKGEEGHGNVSVGDGTGQIGHSAAAGLFAAVVKDAEVTDVLVDGEVKVGNVSAHGGLFAGQLQNASVARTGASGKVQGMRNSAIGGFAGLSMNSSVSYSYAEGQAKGGGNFSKVGGFIGQGIYTNQFYHNYAITEVVVGEGGAAGGFIADTGTNPKMHHNIAAGLIKQPRKGYVGGFFGANMSRRDGKGDSDIHDNFFDTTTGMKKAAVSFGYKDGKLKPQKGVKKLHTKELLSDEKRSHKIFEDVDFATTRRGLNDERWVGIPGVRPMFGWEYPKMSRDGVRYIHNAHQLQLMALDPRTNYALKRDVKIDMDGPSIWGGSENKGKGWVPIGQAGFTGVFDGRGHKIEGLVSSAKGVGSAGGLFVRTENAVIRNLDAEITLLGEKSAKVGLVGSMLNTKVENISVEGRIRTKDKAIGGFIAGESEGGSIQGVKTSGNIHASNHSIAGGIIGRMYNGSTVSSSYSDIDIEAGTKVYVGGIAGVIGHQQRSEHSLDPSVISEVYSTGHLRKHNRDSIVGGLLGFGAHHHLVSSYWSHGTGLENAIGLISHKGGIEDAIGMSRAQMGDVDNFTWQIINRDGRGRWVMADKPRVVHENSTIIRTPIDLAMMWAAPDADYELAQDIDMKTVRNWNGGSGYLAPTSLPFTGRLDGKHYTISEFYSQNHQQLHGLFPLTRNAQIKHLNIRGEVNTNSGEVAKPVYAGILTGRAENTHFNQVNAFGYINTADYVTSGGVAGAIDKDSSVTQSSVTVGARLGQNNLHGSLVGLNEGQIHQVSSRKSRVKSPNLRADSANRAGLLVGANERGASITDFFVELGPKASASKIAGVVVSNKGIVSRGYVGQDEVANWRGDQFAVSILEGQGHAEGIFASLPDGSTLPLQAAGAKHTVEIQPVDMLKRDTWQSSGFNFEDTWNIVDGLSKPFFRYEYFPVYGEFLSGVEGERLGAFHDRNLTVIYPKRSQPVVEKSYIPGSRYYQLIPKATIKQGQLVVLHGEKNQHYSTTLLRYDRTKENYEIDLTPTVKLVSSYDLPFNAGHLSNAEHLLRVRGNVKEKKIGYTTKREHKMIGDHIRLSRNFLTLDDTPYVSTADISSTADITFNGAFYLAFRTNMKGRNIEFHKEVTGSKRDLSVEAQQKLIAHENFGGWHGMGALSLAGQVIDLYGDIRAIKQVQLTGPVKLQNNVSIFSVANGISIDGPIDGSKRLYVQGHQDVKFTRPIGDAEKPDLIYLKSLTGKTYLPKRITATHNIEVRGPIKLKQDTTLVSESRDVYFDTGFESKHGIGIFANHILLTGPIKVEHLTIDGRETLYLNANMKARGRMNLSGKHFLLPEQVILDSQDKKMHYGDLVNAVALWPEKENRSRDYAIIQRGGDHPTMTAKEVYKNVIRMTSVQQQQPVPVSTATRGRGRVQSRSSGHARPHVVTAAASRRRHLSRYELDQKEPFMFKYKMLKDIPGIRPLGPNGIPITWEIGHAVINKHVHVQHGELDGDYFDDNLSEDLNKAQQGDILHSRLGTIVHYLGQGKLVSAPLLGGLITVA